MIKEPPSDPISVRKAEIWRDENPFEALLMNLGAELAALRAENKRYREALRIIADEDRIKHGGVRVHQRWGGIAAHALAANSLPIPSE